MIEVVVRAAAERDRSAVLALADRLPAFGPTTRTDTEVIERERAALAETLSHPEQESPLLVAEHPTRGVLGVMLLQTRRDYFTDLAHGHVSILAVAQEAEGQGVGRALLKASEDWARSNGFAKLTLNVFMDNRHAKEFYARQGWRPEMETWFKQLR